MTPNPWGAAGKPRLPVRGTMADYLALATVGCLTCGVAFSAVVGRLHAQRLGHVVTQPQSERNVA